ncbi:MAG: ATP-binding protein [Gammaproteobacteria bacterium]
MSTDPTPIDPDSAGGRGFGILYVDDEPMSLKYFERAYGREFPIHVAASVDEARALLEEHGDRIGVVIADQRMPGTTGLELLAALRQEAPCIERMLTTAYMDLESAIEAVNSGEIFRYVVKPWDIETLRGYLHEAMDRFTHSRHERALLDTRQQTMLAVAANIAHEMRTPLSSVRSAVSGIRRHLPALIAGYRAAVDANLDVEPLRSAHLQALDGTSDRISRDIDQANTVIDMLLMNTRGEGIDEQAGEEPSMAACIQDSMARYPFTEAQRANVQLKLEDDFAFHGSATLVHYLLFNLTKNALHALAVAGGGHIEITLERATDGVADINRLRFRDTGCGIEADIRERIFDPFFSTKTGGTGNGIGLAFCQRIMTGLQGSIEVQSAPGHFTEFLLSFPAPVTEADHPEEQRK